MTLMRGYLCAGAALLATLTSLSFGFAPRDVLAQAAPRTVKLHILVIEADDKSHEFDKRIEDLRSGMPGVTGAKLLDELEATAEEGASVSLEILRQSGTARLLKVTVRKIEPDKTVKLRIAIDALKFSTDTTHKNAGRFIVRHPLPGGKALFLAVTPKLP